MALDQQRNWTVSMAQNLEKTLRDSKTLANESASRTRRADSKRRTPTPPKVWNSKPVHLPHDVITIIVDFVSKADEAQRTLASCCKLSSLWYDAAVGYLYARPHLEGGNFDLFYRAICPSINQHVRKSPLALLVRTLDMSNLVHQGSKSTTARILGRVKNQLEVFIAPQASFNIACLPALAKCHRLRMLDLSLVSESPPIPDLFSKICHLDSLRILYLPRSSGFGSSVGPKSLTWPATLTHLHLSGGIDTHFLLGAVQFPSSLEHLTIKHCPQARGSALMRLFRTAVRPLPRLRSLKLANLPRCNENSFGNLLAVLPYLYKLSISVEYVSSSFFDYPSRYRDEVNLLPTMLHNLGIKDVTSSRDVDSAISMSMRPDTDQESSGVPMTSPHSHLQVLELTNSGGPGAEDQVSPIDIYMAIEEGSFPYLRRVYVPASIGWHLGERGSESQALSDLLSTQKGSNPNCVDEDHDHPSEEWGQFGVIYLRD